MDRTNVAAFGAAYLLALAGCGGADAPTPASRSPASAAGGHQADSRSLEHCVRGFGAPANPAFFDDQVEAVLRRSGLRLSDALAPPDDDYWLAVDFPTEQQATRAARSLATVWAQGMFGPLEVRRSHASVAIVPPADGPLEEIYRDAPDVEKLRNCTRAYAEVAPRRR